MKRKYTKPPRVFTRAEDELIMLNGQGKIGIRAVERQLRCGRLTVNRRAAELGVTLTVKQSMARGRGTRHRHKMEQKKFDPRENYIPYRSDQGTNPFHVGLLDRYRRDLLLVRLQEEHRGQRYDELDVKEDRDA